MAQRGIREYDAKRILFEQLPLYTKAFKSDKPKLALVTPDTDPKELVKTHPWLEEEKLVVKPDQLFGKRGKHKLLCLNANWKDAWDWTYERMNQEVTVGETKGTLTHFLIEPFFKHAEDDEWFVAIRSERERDIIYFSTKGGIYVEENWDQVVQIPVSILEPVEKVDFESHLKNLGNRKDNVISFLMGLHKMYANAGFSYLEINPFTFWGDDIVPLDMVAKLDDTAQFECSQIWGKIDFPASFGTSHAPEEEFIKGLDEKSGSSLKLTILNPKGRIWSMVAGGGASVIYADTVCDIGFSKELANYGEYSGNPTTEETYQYAKTVLDLMTREKDPKGKFLLIGGGIANFTDVAKTFTGIIQALNEFKDKLIEHKVKIYVRRGGPNYQEGLQKIRKLGETLGVPIEVYGPETHMTKIVSMALK
ncbi:MAG: ATP citrate lyase citrate-binding domain-containing protein [Pseudomonadota bacterium]